MRLAGPLAALLFALVLPAGHAPAEVPACPDERVVKRTPEAVLYLFKPPSGRDHVLAGCVLATGEITDLDNADSFRGAWDLRGTVAAWGHPDCPGEGRRCRTRISVLDLASLTLRRRAGECWTLG